jgi:hypothetical protein
MKEMPFRLGFGRLLRSALFGFGKQIVFCPTFELFPSRESIP